VGMRLALLEVKLALIHSVYRFKFSTTPKTSVYLYLLNFNTFNS
jgi:hypothetical protein